MPGAVDLRGLGTIHDDQVTVPQPPCSGMGEAGAACRNYKIDGDIVMAIAAATLRAALRHQRIGAVLQHLRALAHDADEVALKRLRACRPGFGIKAAQHGIVPVLHALGGWNGIGGEGGD